jgi:phage baseplate assembly protein W
MNSFYKGMSTKRYASHNGLFDAYDVKLIEEDLLNELFTIKGERLHMPDFGTRIPLLVFEPGDDATTRVLEDDIRVVIERDPRVELVAISIILPNDNNAVVAIAKIKYLEFNVVQDLNIEVNSR